VSFAPFRWKSPDGFTLLSFLDDLDRITAKEYEPSDQDIVRARLRTTGVQEYHFTLDNGVFLPHSNITQKCPDVHDS